MLRKHFNLAYVDDDENDLFFFKRAVSRVPNVTVTTFGGGAAAVRHLEALTDAGDAPHILISDLKMPCLDGCGVVRWIRQSKFHCLPVIILSSTSLRDDILACYRAGANAFVTKPMASEDLTALLEITVRFWRDFGITPVAVKTSSASLCLPERPGMHGLSP